MNDTFVRNEKYGGLAQLARAPALQAGGQRFESVILHTKGKGWYEVIFFTFLPFYPFTFKSLILIGLTVMSRFL